MKNIIIVTILTAVFMAPNLAQTQTAKPEVTGEARKSETASPEKKASGKLEDVTVTAEDKFKVKSEKPFLELNMDINEPVLSTIETENKFLEKSPDFSELKNTLPKMLSTRLVAAPYLDLFVKEPVAIFNLKETGFKTSKWDLIITDYNGKVFKKFAGKGPGPEKIEWSGRNSANTVMKVGNPYSYMLNLLNSEGNPRTVIGAPFTVNQLVHQEADGLYLSVTRKKIFDPEKEKTKILEEGAPTLLEILNYLKDMSTLPVRVEVYGEDALTAGLQAKELAKHFTDTLVLTENSIKYNGNEAGLEDFRIDVIIKNRAEVGSELNFKEVVPGNENIKPEKKSLPVKAEPVRMNVEVSLHDFIAKSLTTQAFRINTLLLAGNYKMTDASKNFAATFGPFFCLAEGNNNLGLRASGYYYPFPDDTLNVYASALGAGALSLANGTLFSFGEVKLGIETKISEIEIFGEVGTGLNTSGSATNILASAGVRYYFYPKSTPEAAAKDAAADNNKAKSANKQASGGLEVDRINFEISLHDFIARSLNPAFRINTLFLAANYKMTDSSRKIAAVFGPFFSRAEGDNDLGLRAGGYYYHAPDEAFNLYASISGGSALSLVKGTAYIFGEFKLGLEVKIDEIELFGEAGAGLKTGNKNIITVLNAGVRYYIF